MIEKVNPAHPDKVADRIAGAIVDLAYKKNDNPKIAVEVLLGHGECNIIIESSEVFKREEIVPIVKRIAGVQIVNINSVPQDKHLAGNQAKQVRCGDNGIFKGVPMTEEQKAYCSDAEATVFGNNNTILDDMELPAVTWVGKSLNLESKVMLKLVFSIGNYTGRISDLTARISYADITGNTKTLVLTNAEEYMTGTGLYAFTMDAFLAAELRSVVSVQIYAGDTPMSCTLQYSADTYGNNKTGTLLDLCKALFAYSDSAKAYFIH